MKEKENWDDLTKKEKHKINTYSRSLFKFQKNSKKTFD